MLQLKGLDPRRYAHPLDVEARKKLDALPMAQAIASLLGSLVDTQTQYELLASAVRLGPRQYPSLYRRFVALASALDCPTLPSLYLRQSREVNAWASGISNLVVVLECGLLDLLSDAEVDFVMGHELGHVCAQHMKWQSIAYSLVTLGAMGQSALGPLAPVAGLAIIGAQIAILDWSRKAEFTADRAGLLACQSIDSSLSALGKLAAGTMRSIETVDLEVLVNQGGSLDELTDNSLVAKMLRLQSLMSMTHPYIPVRVHDLKLWHESGEYGSVLADHGCKPGTPSPPPPPPIS